MNTLQEVCSYCVEAADLRQTAEDIGGGYIKQASRPIVGQIRVYLTAECFVTQVCASGGVNITNTFIQFSHDVLWHPNEQN
jgi:hypothetical protein